MRLTDILTEDRVRVARPSDGIKTQADSLEALARLLVSGTDRNAADIHKLLTDRENLQSTGIGDGVAVPHCGVEEVEKQTAAVLLCSEGVDYHSIDDRPVQIIVGVIRPRRTTGEHLRMLARISRLLQDGTVRRRLLEADDTTAAFAVIVEWEDGRF